jgi:peroxiredoxin
VPERINRSLESAGGVVAHTDHPVCAFLTFVDGAATPPLRGGEYRRLLIFVFVCLFTSCAGPEEKQELSPFLQNKKAAVFVFLAPDCPLSQNYTLTLKQLHADFQAQAIGFYGLVAGDAFTKSEVDDFTSKYNVGFPVLADRNFAIADLLGATKTPEAFVVSPEGKTLYKGAIDNWAADLGQRRQVITEHYVRSVLDSFLKGLEIPHRETTAVGCFIERPG